jgi:hypothetical protein
LGKIFDRCFPSQYLFIDIFFATTSGSDETSEVSGSGRNFEVRPMLGRCLGRCLLRLNEQEHETRIFDVLRRARSRPRWQRKTRLAFRCPLFDHFWWKDKDALRRLWKITVRWYTLETFQTRVRCRQRTGVRWQRGSPYIWNGIYLFRMCWHVVPHLYICFECAGTWSHIYIFVSNVLARGPSQSSRFLG